MTKYYLFFVLLLTSQLSIAQEIQVTIKGYDDGVKTNKQQDYKEAVINAKLEAIERAGSEITSFTKIVNFQMKYDSVESKAKGVLLPGFDIMDIGYQTDGRYLVILSGLISAEINNSKKECTVYFTDYDNNDWTFEKHVENWFADHRMNIKINDIRIAAYFNKIKNIWVANYRSSNQSNYQYFIYEFTLPPGKLEVGPMVGRGEMSPYADIYLLEEGDCLLLMEKDGGVYFGRGILLKDAGNFVLNGNGEWDGEYNLKFPEDFTKHSLP